MTVNSPFVKKILLLLTGTGLLVVFFLLPRNRSWLTSQILTYWSDLPVQKNELDEEQRMDARFKTYYTYSKQVAADLKNAGCSRDELVLMPSTSYFQQHHVNYHVPEPAVFYYFTGYKITWPDNKDAENATWYVRAEQSKIVVARVTPEIHFADTLAFFRKYKSAL